MEKLRIIGAAILDREGNEFFTLDQVVEISGVDRLAVRRILEKLNRESLVIRIAKKPTYQLANVEIELGKGRPPLALTYCVGNKKKLTERVAPKLRENTTYDRMWSVIRNKNKVDGNFSVRDLVTLGEVKRENARWYLKRLRKAGFVQPSKAGGRGVTWVLLKDPGPRRPAIQKSEIRDQRSDGKGGKP